MNDNGHIEIKTGNFYPKNAKEIVDKGSVDILVARNKLSEKTKDILSAADIVLYEKVDDDTVKKVNSMLK